MALGFFVDTAACSGCKACQVACKDTHDLEAGRLWRRVATIEGGEWVPSGAAWTTTAFAYSVSMSCMHCEKPACVDGCPTGAMHKREDGVVLVEATRCIGCRYCEWVCPYGAPRYDAATRRMTKCDFCVDELAAGRPPACVAACPMRALDFGELPDLERRHGTTRDLYPLPDSSLTRPALVLTHRAVAGGHLPIALGLQTPHVGNREEL